MRHETAVHSERRVGTYLSIAVIGIGICTRIEATFLDLNDFGNTTVPNRTSKPDLKDNRMGRREIAVDHGEEGDCE